MAFSILNIWKIYIHNRHYFTTKIGLFFIPPIPLSLSILFSCFFFALFFLFSSFKNLKNQQIFECTPFSFFSWDLALAHPKFPGGFSQCKNIVTLYCTPWFLNWWVFFFIPLELKTINGYMWRTFSLSLSLSLSFSLSLKINIMSEPSVLNGVNTPPNVPCSTFVSCSSIIQLCIW